MAQDKRYARGAEDMQEFIARWLEGVKDGSPASILLCVAADFIRHMDPEDVRQKMKQDDAWMRKVAEREVERQRAASCERSKAYYRRQKRKATGEDVPPVKRGPKSKGA